MALVRAWHARHISNSHSPTYYSALTHPLPLTKSSPQLWPFTQSGTICSSWLTTLLCADKTSDGTSTLPCRMGRAAV